MKRFLVAVLTVLCLAAVAVGQPQAGAQPAPTRYNLRFESRHGETFSVFVDGDLKNRMPQSRVLVNDVSDQTHEVVVVQKRPVEKAAVIDIRPGEPTVVVYVDYDSRLEKVSLYTASHNRPEEQQPIIVAVRPRPHDEESVSHHPQSPQQPQTQVVEVVDDDLLNSMAAQMKAQSFDSDRLALGKTIVASAYFTAEQIAYLARTLDYSQSQVDFLKYAYAYCVDKNNYHSVVDVLTYRSDKQKVIDYIATQP